MHIVEDKLTHPKVVALLGEHVAGMRAATPVESSHALDLDELRADDVTCWTIWEAGHLLGCSALQELDSRHGEIKSMRTVSRHLRRGVASTMLEHLLREATRRGYERLSLETGSGPEFDASRAFYRKFGFDYCKPFAGYREDPFSCFMTREI